MSERRRIRRANIDPTMGERPVLAGWLMTQTILVTTPYSLGAWIYYLQAGNQ